MGVNYNARIVTNGLVLHLDAANPKSYPGSGNTWYDLSGNGNHASMYGSVPYSTDIAQCFDFATATGSYSGTSSLGFTLTRGVNPSLGGYTFECWVKNPNLFSGQAGMFANAGGDSGFRWGPGQNSVYVLCGPTYSETGIVYSTPYDNTIWNHIVTIYDRGGVINGNPVVYVYKNGILQTNTMQLPSSQTSQSQYRPGIVRSPCCSIWTGKLALLRVYQSILTGENILQNFTALRGRFQA